MKRFLRWLVYVLIGLIVLVVIAIFSLDMIAKSVAKKKIRAQTGMEAKIGTFHISLRDRNVHIADLKLIKPEGTQTQIGMDVHVGKLDFNMREQTVHVENFKLVNPPEFGGSTFVDMPELHLKMDMDKLQANQMHLPFVRLNIAEVHVVQNKDGKRNTDLFTKQNQASPPSGPGSSTNQSQQIQFAGIDTLQLTLGHAKFTNEQKPGQNFDRDLGIRDKVYHDIKNEKDLQNVGALIAAQAGFSMLLEGIFTNPKEVLQKGAGGGKQTKEILKSIVAPFKKKKE